MLLRHVEQNILFLLEPKIRLIKKAALIIVKTVLIEILFLKSLHFLYKKGCKYP